MWLVLIILPIYFNALKRATVLSVMLLYTNISLTKLVKLVLLILSYPYASMR